MINIIVPHLPKRNITPHLESIFSQTYKDYRIIISVDWDMRGHWWNCMRGYCDNADYVLFTDDDSTLEPDCLKIMVDTLEGNPTYSWAYSMYTFGKLTMTSMPFNVEQLKKGNYIDMCSLIRTKDFVGIKNFGRLDDFEMWLRMVEAGKEGWYIKKVLFHKASGNGSLSDDNDPHRYYLWYNKVCQAHKNSGMKENHDYD